MSISIHSFSILREKRQTRIIEAWTNADTPKSVKMQVIDKEIDEKEFRSIKKSKKANNMDGGWDHHLGMASRTALPAKKNLETLIT